LTDTPGDPPPQDGPSYPPPPPPGPAGYPPPVQTDDTVWAVLAHLSLFFLALLGPLLIYLLVGDSRPFAKRQAAEALNFHITLLLASVVSLLLIVIVVGFVLLAILVVGSVVLAIVAAVQAGNRQDFRYPFTWRLIS
jgi:uncharacterized Tic20 family protein